MYHIKNKVQLIGKVSTAPTITNLENDRKRMTLSLDTEEVIGHKAGKKEIETITHVLVGYGKVADLVENHVKKGKEIAIEGKLTHRSYTDKDGEKRYVTEVEVREILLLSKD